jgi:hypothetical protein
VRCSTLRDQETEPRRNRSRFRLPQPFHVSVVGSPVHSFGFGYRVINDAYSTQFFVDALRLVQSAVVRSFPL